MWMRDNACTVGNFVDAETCNSFFLNAQDLLGDARTCAARRRARVPDAVRLLYSQICECVDEGHRKQLHAQVVSCFREHRARVDAERAHFIVRTGKVFQRAKKLYPVESLILEDGTRTASRDEWTAPLLHVFKSKWQTMALQQRELLLDMIRRTEGSSGNVQWHLLCEAVDCIKKVSARDAYGVSMLILRAFIFGNPTAAVSLFTNLLRDSSFMQTFYIQGTIYGKESAHTTPAKTRAILPLPALLNVVDALVAMRIHCLVDSICVPPLGVFFGARKGTQVLDIAHAAQLHMQRGGDNFGHAGFAQGDVATYFDSIRCLLIARWLQSHGEDLFWVSAFLRIQMLPIIVLTAGGSCSFQVDNRTMGTLTGSRTAVAAGRVPVESVACQKAHEWQPYAVSTDTSPVIFCAWVDNYYTFGNSFHSSISIAQSFEQALGERWGLSIKPSSRSVLSPMLPATAWDSSKWHALSAAEVLGHLVSADTSPWPRWRKTEKAMWCAFWSNCVGPQCKDLSLAERLRMLDRCVRPVLFFRCTRWAWTTTLSQAQDRLQRRMLSQFFRIERLPLEDADKYHRRRMRAISNLARQHGTWGQSHAQRVVSWAAHLERPRNSKSPAAIFHAWHGSSWLDCRRRDPDVGGVGRPGTRSASGPVVARWEDGVINARMELR